MASFEFSSSVPSVDPTPNWTKDVVDGMCDPVTYEPFTKAQSIKCGNGHSLSLSTIDAILSSSSLTHPASCPLCRGRFTKYSPNRSLQTLVDSMLGIEKGPQHMEKMFEMVRNLKLEFDNGIRYPFRKSTFQYTTHNDSEEYRSLSLSNTLKKNDGHAFKNISISCYLTNCGYRFDFCLCCFERETMDEVMNYFEKNNIVGFKDKLPEVRDLSILSLNTLSSEEILTSLMLIMNNNEFDDKSTFELDKMIDFFKSVSDKGIRYPFKKTTFQYAKHCDSEKHRSLSLSNTFGKNDGYTFKNISIDCHLTNYGYRFDFCLGCFERETMDEVINYFEKNNIVGFKDMFPEVRDLSVLILNTFNSEEILSSLMLIKNNNKFDDKSTLELDKMINFLKSDSNICIDD